MAALPEVPVNTYFEVPAGVLPEATADYYKDPVLKVGSRIVAVYDMLDGMQAVVQQCISKDILKVREACSAGGSAFALQAAGAS